MRVQVLTVPDCPNRDEAVARVRRALHQAGVGEVAVEELVVDTAAAARSIGMAGSPTVLIDGLDPFTDASGVASLSCRLYPTSTGFEGAPTVEALVAVLQGAR